MSAHFTTPTDELLLLAETLGEVKTKADKLEAEFSTQARPLEAATNALSAALSGIKALQFHVLDNNLGALSARVEEMRKAVDEQVGVIALELKKADETNAAKAGQEAEALRSEIAALQAQLGTLGAQFSAQLERVEFSAKEEAKKLQLIPGPAGAAGASLNPRGTFIDGETYNRLDVVTWLGSSYIAAVDGVTEKPSKNSNQWQVLASRGSGGAGGAGDFGSLAGVAQINQGGTGQTTRAAGLNALLPSQTGAVQYMLLTDGAGTVSWGAQPVAGLPSQTGNSGELLTTDGVNASWSNAVTVSGSNATVAGTLTVNGGGVFTRANTGALAIKSGDAGSYTDISLGRTAAEHFLAIAGSANNYVVGTVAGDCALNASSATAAIFVGVYGNAIGKFTSSGLSIPTTTASTTTSTGALVVGGGLGVGGAINAGGRVVSNASSTIADINGFAQTTGYSSGGKTYTGFSSGGIALNQSASFGYVYDSGTPANSFAHITPYGITEGALFKFSPAGVLTLGATTASTTTSTGALVVGNGTSGGLGVGGSINLGANLVSTASDGKIQVNGTGNTTLNKELTFQRSDAADSFAVGLTGSAYAGSLTGLGNNEAYLYNSSASAFRVFIGTAATNRFDFTSTQFKINATTASTSTSSGALVVSGGVGIDKELYLGGVLESSSGSGIRIRTASGTAAKFSTIQTAWVTWEMQNKASSTNFTITADGTVDALTLASSGNATVGGSIRTSAPSGGTSANWKLGTVATVSPTSPNRTIEVDIGGTIYYLAAKTTNN